MKIIYHEISYSLSSRVENPDRISAIFDVLGPFLLPDPEPSCPGGSAPDTPRLLRSMPTSPGLRVALLAVVVPNSVRPLGGEPAFGLLGPGHHAAPIAQDSASLIIWPLPSKPAAGSHRKALILDIDPLRDAPTIFLCHSAVQVINIEQPPGPVFLKSGCP
jgi:hypothetical protein